jgi:uncharacterized protein (TIGR02145 family)
LHNGLVVRFYKLKTINMKNIMKKQCKKFPSWRCKGLLSVALSGLAVVAHAQAAEVCTGTPYTIASTVNASSASTYQWLENGRVITNATALTYTVPVNTPEGVYSYIRQAKSADCSEWQSSNEFTLTVFACSFTAGTATGATATFTDPRDGKQYKTVVMPDGRTWFAQNLNYTKGLTFNMYSNEANGKQFITPGKATVAIGSYWCPGIAGSTYSGDQNMCNIYGAIYTWETVMMVDGKYADESKMSSAWDESWVSPYYFNSGMPYSNADKNNGRGSAHAKGGGRGICPMGWHIPTAFEWANLLDVIEGNNIFAVNIITGMYVGTVVGQKLKSVDTKDDASKIDLAAWLKPTTPGTDDYQFRVVPAGNRGSSGEIFHVLGMNAQFHSSTSPYDGAVTHIDMERNHPGAIIQNNTRASGYTSRCIMD